MTLRERQTIFWQKVAVLILYAAEKGKPVFPTQWLRSAQEQVIMVARGAAKTRRSKHLLGLAVDLVFLSDVQDDGRVNYTPEDYRFLGEFWEALGGRWGGRFGDNPTTEKIEGWDAGHFEEGIW